jgi:methylated-DNA-[protein]-cysteine S-methyltransferase
MNDQLTPFWQTPVGWISLAGGTAGIQEIILHSDVAVVRRSVRDSRTLPAELLLIARGQIEEYFAGERRIFDLPLVYPDWSPFAIRVLNSLRQVPFGNTITYGELAKLADHSLAARAVGGVMARNPFPLVIPCHRVIGAGGGMTGYSGGEGIASKEWLLRFERELERKSLCPQ